MQTFLEKIKPYIQKRASQIQFSENPCANKLDFCSIFNKNHPSLQPVIIAEIKLASPSKGKLYNGQFSVAEIAESYLKNQASALSVLTEPEFFKGDITYITTIRNKLHTTPILCKDFIISKQQISQALYSGANAILLIVAFLKKQELKILYDYAISLKLTPIIEVHDIHELNQALSLNPKIIGVNNRNLSSLEINLNTSRTLIKEMPKNIFKLCESGISNLSEIQEMQELGFDGFLIGSQFMIASDPGQALNQLLQGETHAR
jgi:indole-3-glycerol phosphate synthase